MLADSPVLIFWDAASKAAGYAALMIVIGLIWSQNLVFAEQPRQREVAAEAMGRLAIVADTFRQGAAANVDDAVRRYFSNECAARWRKEVDPLFKNDNWQLSHMFAFSLIMMGDVGARDAVVAFYNPWVDVALLTHWRHENSAIELRDYVFLTGESLRGTKVADNKAVPVWVTDKGKSKQKAVAEIAESSIAAFTKRFPLEGAFEFLPSDLEGLRRESAREVETIQSRMLLRAAYRAEALDSNANASVEKAIGSLKNLIVEGDLNSLLSALSKDQDRFVAETALKLPQAIRSSLTPNWLLRTGNLALVFLSSPVAPRFYVSVTLDISDGVSTRSIYVYDFNVQPVSSKKAE